MHALVVVEIHPVRNGIECHVLGFEAVQSNTLLNAMSLRDTDELPGAEYQPIVTSQSKVDFRKPPADDFPIEAVDHGRKMTPAILAAEYARRVDRPKEPLTLQNKGSSDRASISSRQSAPLKSPSKRARNLSNPEAREAIR
jgi:hypothetical protein